MNLCVCVCDQERERIDLPRLSLRANCQEMKAVTKDINLHNDIVDGDVDKLDEVADETHDGKTHGRS